MGNKFEVQVVALDRFTKTFRDLNNRASQAVRPLTNVQRQVGMLSREMHLDKIAKGMTRVSQVSMTMARSIGAATAPLEGLLGLGMAGGAVGVAGGLAALASRWGSLGFEVNRTSSMMGVSATELQRLRGAAKLAGVDSDGLTGSLASLGDTLQDALYGRNQQALLMLNKLGVTIKRNANGVVDTAAGFNDISLAISRIADPHVQAIVARAFGLEAALPLLRQGPEAIKRLADEAQRAGLVMGGDALKKADAFTESLNRLKAAAEGAANTAGGRLGPLLTPAIDAVTGLLNGDKKSAAGGGMSRAQEVEKSRAFVWDSVRRWLNGGKLGLFKDFGPSASLAQRSSSGVVQYGDAAPQPLGMRLNNPGNLRSWGGVPTVGGFAQFGSPAEGLSAMAKQLGLYFGRDGLNTISGIVSKYAPASENNTAAYIASVAKQTGFGANQALDLSDPKQMAPLLSAMVKHEQGKQPFTPDQYAQAAQNVKVEVTFANAPAGTQAKAKSDSGQFLPTRVSYSMPTTVTP